MPAIIFAHPRAEVKLHDPRDPEVRDRYALPQPGITEPIHLQALRSSLPAEHCAACGEAVAYHYDTSGCLYIGCDGVPARKALAGLTQRPLRDVTTWGDAHPAVSAAIRDALRVGCGVDVAAWFDALRVDEQVNLSRRLAELAAVALRKEDAQR